MKSANERKAAERARKRASGLKPMEIWRPEKIPRDVKFTLKYMQSEIERGADVTLDAESAQELLEYLQP